jgi:hypothetical protein
MTKIWKIGKSACMVFKSNTELQIFKWLDNMEAYFLECSAIHIENRWNRKFHHNMLCNTYSQKQIYMQDATYMLSYLMMALGKGLFIFGVSKLLIQAANKRPYTSVLSGLPGF